MCIRDRASWTAPDGSSHQGTVPAAEEPPRPGDRFRIWTDARGRLVGQPLDPSAAVFHAGTYIRLDRAWAAAGPDWGRAGAGS